MEQSLKPTQEWEGTGIANLLKRSNGVYYARVSVNGVRRIASLGTTLKQVAIARLRDRMEEAESSRMPVACGTGREDVRMLSGGDCERLFLERVDADPELGASSRRNYRDGCKRVRATWTGFEALKVSRITARDCAAWLERARVMPTKAGADWKRAGGAPSPTVTNIAIRALRGMLEEGVRAGALPRNPAADLKTTATRQRKPRLPDSAMLPKILAQMRSVRGRSVLAADFVEGLATTGMRRAEAAALCWRHVDFPRGLVEVPGTKSASAHRIVPLVPDALALLHRLRSESPTATPETRVFAVSEAQKSLDAACAAVGAERLVHHDLRHLFATRCIEAGVDIPTVSRWLGHSDGGALAMRVYGHLRLEHSKAAAAKVSFGLNPAHG